MESLLFHLIMEVTKMKLTNIGTKVIFVCGKVLLPDSSIEVDKNVAELPSVKALINKKMLSCSENIVTTETTAEVEKTTKTRKPRATKTEE